MSTDHVLLDDDDTLVLRTYENTPDFLPDLLFNGTCISYDVNVPQLCADLLAAAGLSVSDIPPPAPATEFVSWHEAKGRVLPDGRTIRVVFDGNSGRMYGPRYTGSMSVPADGLIEVRK